MRYYGRFKILHICVVLNLSVFNANLENDECSFSHSKTHNRRGEKYQKKVSFCDICRNLLEKKIFFHNFAQRSTLGSDAAPYDSGSILIFKSLSFRYDKIGVVL